MPVKKKKVAVVRPAKVEKHFKVTFKRKTTAVTITNPHKLYSESNPLHWFRSGGIPNIVVGAAYHGYARAYSSDVYAVRVDKSARGVWAGKIFGHAYNIKDLDFVIAKKETTKRKVVRRRKMAA